MIFQLRPLFEVWEALAHVAGFQPGIGASLAAEPSHVARRALIVVVRLCVVHGTFEDFPPLANCSCAEIVLRNGE